MTAPAVSGDLIAGFATIARGLPERSIVSLPLSPLTLAPLGSAEPTRLLRDATIVWRPPSDGATTMGFGCAVSLSEGRQSGVADASRAFDRWTRMPRFVDPSVEVEPAFFGGAQFGSSPVHDGAWDRFGGWRFVLPTYLVRQCGSELRGTATLVLDRRATTDEIAGQLEVAAAPLSSVPPDSCPPSGEAWQDAVNAATREIAYGSYGKVVLARGVHERLPPNLHNGVLLARLAERYPSCYLFKLAVGGGAFLGATPELLCQLEHKRVSAPALAGSRERGANAADDDALAAGLASDSKELHEHMIVVRAISDVLAPFCTELSVAPEPAVFRVSNIQHLRTPITGTLRGETPILDLVTALHPSPAVGGSPRSRALDAITRLEHLDRGWYAGPIGRIGLDGNGEFVVGLRSALVFADRAQLYAGAGIVRGSDPVRELRETEMKLRPMREAVLG